ncbi:MAG TPA: Ig-like domain-containing protein, partial [Candidatus Hydrogenedentes bacterium]|nr:Ig-like domain-containing protein [Candidatus Hydrogenedentota bacterium]
MMFPVSGECGKKRPVRAWRVLGALLAAAIFLGASFHAHAGIRRVLLVGDSWTQFLWKDRIVRTMFMANGLGVFEEKGDLTALSGSTASLWATQPLLDLITFELLTNPTIDTVHLSLGGNDFMMYYHTSLSAGQRAAFWAQIRANIQTVVNHILSVRPNIRVLIVDYDYMNFVESLAGYFPNLTFNPTSVALWWHMGFPSAGQLNSALIELGHQKLEIARTTRRCEYIQNFGLCQNAMGYPTAWLFPGSAPFPGGAPNYWPYPGGYPTYPNTPLAMHVIGGGFLDPIHLNVNGYRLLVQNCINQYYLDWMLHPYIPDLTPPTVKSVAILDQSPTNAARVRFLVTFSEDVVNVDHLDFSVSAPNMDGASVVDVSGSGSVYTVTVQTGVGDASLRLDVADNDSIEDMAGNRLGGTGAGNGSFTLGESYRVDTLPPTATLSASVGNPTTQNPFDVTVTFSEPVVGFGLPDVQTSNSGAGVFRGLDANFTFELVPFEPGLVQVWIPAGVAKDIAGNDNVATSILTRQYTGQSIRNPYSNYLSDGSDGDMVLYSGAIDIDTDTLVISGAYNAIGRNDFGVCVFDFNSIDVNSNVTVNLHGQRPLSLTAKESIIWGATLNASGDVAGRCGGGVGGSGGAGGAGGCGGAGG